MRKAYPENLSRYLGSSDQLVGVTKISIVVDDNHQPALVIPNAFAFSLKTIGFPGDASIERNARSRFVPLINRTFETHETQRDLLGRAAQNCNFRASPCATACSESLQNPTHYPSSLLVCRNGRNRSTRIFWRECGHLADIYRHTFRALTGTGLRKRKLLCCKRVSTFSAAF